MLSKYKLSSSKIEIEHVKEEILKEKQGGN